MTPRTPWLRAAVGWSMIAAFGAGPASAAEPQADAPTATAPAGPSVADQIAAYLRDSPVARLPADAEPVGVTGSAARRQPHGVVEVAVGNHGYRSVYVRSDLPIGETGTLSIAVGETRGGRGLYAPYGAYGGYDGFGPGDLRGPACRSRLDADRDEPCLRRSSRVIQPGDHLDADSPADPAR